MKARGIRYELLERPRRTRFTIHDRARMEKIQDKAKLKDNDRANNVSSFYWVNDIEVRRCDIL